METAPPGIVEDFDREIYGRVPKIVPKVKWEVTKTANETTGEVPVTTKQLVGHVDNSAYPQLTVDIQLALTTPANAADPYPWSWSSVAVALDPAAVAHVDLPVGQLTDILGSLSAITAPRCASAVLVVRHRRAAADLLRSQPRRLRFGQPHQARTKHGCANIP